MSKGMEAAILSIASDLQTILGEATITAIAISPQKPAAPKIGALLQHRWPTDVRRDVDNTRRQVKTLRRLASLAARQPEDITSDTSPHNALWSEVNTHVPLRTYLSPLPRDLASLAILHR